VDGDVIGVETQGHARSARKIDDEADEEYAKMRSIAIWEAQATMERGVSERDDASTFLA
jgi:hypothetical protein